VSPQPENQPIPKDSVGKQLALSYTTLLAEHLEFANRELVAVNDGVQLADQLLDCGGLGEDFDRLPICDRASGGWVTGADHRREARGSD
jgi:hypothetical protein